MNRFRAVIIENLQSNVWLIPSIFCMTSIALAGAVFAIEQHYKPELLGFTPNAIGVEAARQIHGVIASSVISVAGVTFSVTMVALTLTSGQYGPRVVRTYLEDHRSKVTLGLFLGTGLYSLTCLSMYEASDQPFLSVTVALVLTVLSLAGFIRFIHATATDLQADQIVQRIGNDFKRSLAEFGNSAVKYHHSNDILAWRRRARGKKLTVFGSSMSGYVQTVDYDALLLWCASLDGAAQIRVRAGDFVLPGSCLLKLYSDASSVGDAEQVNQFFLIGPIRTSIQDPEYSVTQLNQLAARALSPGINDPGTAISCVHGFATGLSQIIDHELPGKVLQDDSRAPRLLLRLTDFPGIMKAIYAPLRQMACSEISVQICLFDSLVRLAELTTRADRLSILQLHADHVWDEVERGCESNLDISDIRQRYNRLTRLARRLQ